MGDTKDLIEPAQEDEHQSTLLAVIRVAINNVLKYPFSSLRDREKCLRVVLVALDTLEERKAAAVNEQAQKIDRLRAENAALRDALAHYAAHENWMYTVHNADAKRVFVEPGSHTPELHNGWERAEQALSGQPVAAPVDRNAVLEEAAGVCNELGRRWSTQGYSVGTYGAAHDCAGAIRALKDSAPSPNENMELRKLLATAYCPPHSLYADDGELQDNRAHPHINFMRDSVEQIRHAMQMRAWSNITPSREDADQAPSTQEGELQAKLAAWRESLNKGIKLCNENGHGGDAETLKDIAEHLSRGDQAPSAEPVAWCDPTNADPTQMVTFDLTTRNRWPHIYTKPLYAAPPAPAPADSVPMPQNEDQAAAMALIGHKWLADNAPHRLRNAAADQPAGKDAARYRKKIQLAHDSLCEWYRPNGAIPPTYEAFKQHHDAELDAAIAAEQKGGAE